MGSFVIIAIAVLFIILRAAGAANKKAKDQERKNNTGEAGHQSAPPPNMSTMSDIQKAFMMMTDEEPKKKAPAQANTASVNRAGEGFGSYEGNISHEGKAGSEGVKGMHEGTLSHEGTAGKTEGSAFHPSGFHSSQNKFSNINLGKYTKVKDTEDDKAIKVIKKTRKSPLKLFENKDAFTKAVIYSEILNRRAR